MIEINLVPDVKQEFLKAQRLRNTVISIAIMVGIASIAMVILLTVAVLGQKGFEWRANQNIESENAKLQAVEDLDNTVTIQNQLKVLAGMHDEKRINSRIFDLITIVNPPAPNDVTISNLVLDPELRVLTIQGSAVNGYASVEVFKKTILNTDLEYVDGGELVKEPLSKTVNVSETSYGEDAEGRKVLRFELSFEYPEQLLSRTVENARIVSPTNAINVTDSFIRVPESLFAERPNDFEEGDN